jgi:hypothetical protein
LAGLEVSFDNIYDLKGIREVYITNAVTSP